MEKRDKKILKIAIVALIIIVILLLLRGCKVRCGSNSDCNPQLCEGVCEKNGDTFSGQMKCVDGGCFCVCEGKAGVGQEYKTEVGDLNYSLVSSRKPFGKNMFSLIFPNLGKSGLSCIDKDGDGYGEGSGCKGLDCNDNDKTIYLGAPEICDNKDNNCGGNIDENCEKFCGNGNIDSGESCDIYNWGNINNCTDLGFFSGKLVCDEECHFNTQGCNSITQKEVECSNGVLDVGEECDTLAPKGKTCRDFGNFKSGNLKCSNECKIDNSECSIKQDCCIDADGDDYYTLKNTEKECSELGSIFTQETFIETLSDPTNLVCVPGSRVTDLIDNPLNLGNNNLIDGTLLDNNKCYEEVIERIPKNPGDKLVTLKSQGIKYCRDKLNTQSQNYCGNPHEEYNTELKGKVVFSNNLWIGAVGEGFICENEVSVGSCDIEVYDKNMELILEKEVNLNSECTGTTTTKICQLNLDGSKMNYEDYTVGFTMKDDYNNKIIETSQPISNIICTLDIDCYANDKFEQSCEEVCSDYGLGYDFPKCNNDAYGNRGCYCKCISKNVNDQATSKCFGVGFVNLGEPLEIKHRSGGLKGGYHTPISSMRVLNLKFLGNRLSVYNINPPSPGTWLWGGIIPTEGMVVPFYDLPWNIDCSSEALKSGYYLIDADPYQYNSKRSGCMSSCQCVDFPPSGYFVDGSLGPTYGKIIEGLGDVQDSDAEYSIDCCMQTGQCGYYPSITSEYKMSSVKKISVNKNGITIPENKNPPTSKKGSDNEGYTEIITKKLVECKVTPPKCEGTECVEPKKCEGLNCIIILPKCVDNDCTQPKKCEEVWPDLTNLPKIPFINLDASSSFFKELLNNKPINIDTTLKKCTSKVLDCDDTNPSKYPGGPQDCECNCPVRNEPKIDQVIYCNKEIDPSNPNYCEDLNLEHTLNLDNSDQDYMWVGFILDDVRCKNGYFDLKCGFDIMTYLRGDGITKVYDSGVRVTSTDGIGETLFEKKDYTKRTCYLNEKAFCQVKISKNELNEGEYTVAFQGRYTPLTPGGTWTVSKPVNLFTITKSEIQEAISEDIIQTKEIKEYALKIPQFSEMLKIHKQTIWWEDIVEAYPSESEFENLKGLGWEKIQFTLTPTTAKDGFIWNSPKDKITLHDEKCSLHSPLCTLAFGAEKRYSKMKAIKISTNTKVSIPKNIKYTLDGNKCTIVSCDKQEDQVLLIGSDVRRPYAESNIGNYITSIKEAGNNQISASWSFSFDESGIPMPAHEARFYISILSSETEKLSDLPFIGQMQKDMKCEIINKQEFAGMCYDLDINQINVETIVLPKDVEYIPLL
nr:hypothetical protein [uncultured archaeon]